MILRDKPNWVELAFAVRGSIVPLIAPRIAGLMLFSSGMVMLHHRYAAFPNIEAVGFTVFGIALSLFLGFRNNAAYDRWWEARKLWGTLLADLRSFAREVGIFVDDQEQQKRMIKGSLAFIHLHRANLRQLADDPRARELGREMADARHPPCAALDAIAAELNDALRSGHTDGFGAKALQERLGSMALQQAGCERIANTPLPYVYSLLVYRTTYLYCILLPLALVGTAGWLTPVFVGIVGYVFLGLAEVTEDLSHPFGATPNALPLDSICRSAEIALAPHLGEEPPEALQPINFCLS